MTGDLITMGASSALGFVFKFMAEGRKSKDEALRRLIETQKTSSESADSAEKRGGAGGVWVRRFLVVSIVLAVIGFPFIASFLEVPTFVEVSQNSRQYLFGLVGGSEKTDYHQIDGYLLVQENRTVLLALSSFYFGQAAGR
jgi:hypothetical protein